MDAALADLLVLLNLERLEVNMYRGTSRDIGNPQVFGGQVLGQALMAATSTVDDRIVHSLHAYFLRAGDFNLPIVYEVDRSRDGASFSSRRVVAIQNGQQIFHMSASFQSHEEGLEHQAPMPDVPPPESLPKRADWISSPLLTDQQRRFFDRVRPFDIRPVDMQRLLNGEPKDPKLHVWFRAADKLPDGEALHRGILAYVSDYYLLMTATLPHGIPFPSKHIRFASIDHAMWFHRPVRVDDWLLYSIDSPSSSGARGLSRGSIFSRDGRLVASTAQEGLMRVMSEARAKGGEG
jgi:acyl-CoA thioesterase-2